MVVVAGALLVLEVDRDELLVPGPVLAGQDLPVSHEAVAVEELLEHDAEVVARLRLLGEVEVPGKDVGELVHQVGLLPERDHGVEDRATDDAGEPDHPSLERDLFVRGGEASVLARAESVDVAAPSLELEREDQTVVVLYEREEVAGVRVTEVEDRPHGADDPVDGGRAHALLEQRRVERAPRADPSGQHVEVRTLGLVGQLQAEWQHAGGLRRERRTDRLPLGDDV
jgi:hypothetical protein